MKHYSIKKLSKIKKSQESLEYITIFGIAFIILSIVAGVFFSYVNETKQSLDKQQIDNIANEVISNIEKIYFLGKGNRLTTSANFPVGIENISIHHKKTPQGEPFDYLNISFYQDGVFISNIYETKETYIQFNCTLCNKIPSQNISYYNSSDYSAGIKNIKIESKGTWINVDFVNDFSN